MLLGFVAGTPEGVQAALFYTLVYVIMAAGSFGFLIASRHGFERKIVRLFPAHGEAHVDGHFRQQRAYVD